MQFIFEKDPSSSKTGSSPNIFQEQKGACNPTFCSFRHNANKSFILSVSVKFNVRCK